MAPMMASRWRGELKAAASDTDVLNVARDYVAALATDERALLPPDLTPGPLTSCGEIAEWALKLVQASLSMSPDERRVATLRDVGEFFAAASSRLSELQVRPRGRR